MLAVSFCRSMNESFLSFFLSLFFFFPHITPPVVRILACLLISGEVGERLIHLVGDRFVFTALIYQYVCNEKGGNVVLVDGMMVNRVYILILFLIGKRKREREREREREHNKHIIFMVNTLGLDDHYICEAA